MSKCRYSSSFYSSGIPHQSIHIMSAIRAMQLILWCCMDCIPCSNFSKSQIRRSHKHMGIRQRLQSLLPHLPGHPPFSLPRRTLVKDSSQRTRRRQMHISTRFRPKIKLYQRPILLFKHRQVVTNPTVPDPIPQRCGQPVEHTTPKFLKILQHHIHFQLSISCSCTQLFQRRRTRRFTHHLLFRQQEWMPCHPNSPRHRRRRSILITTTAPSTTGTTTTT